MKFANVYTYLVDGHILCDAEVGKNGEYNIVKRFPLTKITADMLSTIRASGKPGFVLKQTSKSGNPEYWYTSIPADFSLVAKKWCPHNCGECTVLGSKEGASLKTCAWAGTIRDGMMFEKLPYIECAVEIFNTLKTDSLKIALCANFEPYAKKEKVSYPIGVRKRNALMLAQHLDESLETFQDLHEFEQKNRMGI